MLRPVRTIAPAEPVISLAEAKKHLNVTHDADDALIGAYVAAATALLDGQAGILGRCMVTQTWRQDFGCWPRDIIRLPFCDVRGITSLVYSDTDNVEQTVSSSLYHRAEDALSSYIWLRRAFTYPSVYDDRPDPIRCTFTVGFGNATDVPEALKHAIKLMIGDYYENREEVAIGPGLEARQLPTGVTALITPFRRVGL